MSAETKLITMIAPLPDERGQAVQALTTYRHNLDLAVSGTSEGVEPFFGVKVEGGIFTNPEKFRVTGSVAESVNKQFAQKLVINMKLAERHNQLGNYLRALPHGSLMRLAIGNVSAYAVAMKPAVQEGVGAQDDIFLAIAGMPVNDNNQHLAPGSLAGVARLVTADAYSPLNKDESAMSNTRLVLAAALNYFEGAYGVRTYQGQSTERGHRGTDSTHNAAGLRVIAAATSANRTVSGDMWHEGHNPLAFVPEQSRAVLSKDAAMAMAVYDRTNATGLPVSIVRTRAPELAVLPGAFLQWDRRVAVPADSGLYHVNLAPMAPLAESQLALIGLGNQQKGVIANPGRALENALGGTPSNFL